MRTWEKRARSAFYRTNEVVRIDASAKKIGRCFADTFRKQQPQTKATKGGWGLVSRRGGKFRDKKQFRRCVGLASVCVCGEANHDEQPYRGARNEV